MSSLASNDYMDFTHPTPPRAQSPPSGALSPPPNPLSWLLMSSPSIYTPPNQTTVASPTDHSGDSIMSLNLHLLDGLSNHNISGSIWLHPSQLNPKFCQAGCQTYYVVTVGWEVGIFDNWGITRTRVEALSNKSYKSFREWDQAVKYYAQCYMEGCIEIRAPKFFSPSPMPNRRQKKQQPVPNPSSNTPTAQPPASAQPIPAQPQLLVATPILVSASDSEAPSTPHSIGTESRPITVSPSTLLPANPSKSLGARAGKSVNFKNQSGKGKERDSKETPHVASGKQATRTTSKASDVKKSIHDKVIVISSESEDGDVVERPPANPPRLPAIPAIGRRHCIVIIDDEPEETDETSCPNKKIRRYRVAVHTMIMKQPNAGVPLTSKPSGQKTVPLPVQLFNIAINASDAGVAGPSGTGPSHLNITQSFSTKNMPEQEETDLDFSDIDPELLATF